METALAGLIISIVLIFALLTLSQTALTTQDLLVVGEQEMQTRLTDQARTDLEIVSAQVISPGTSIQMMVRNTGDVKLADFDEWDMILEYYRPTGVYTYTVNWLPYTAATLQADEWTVDAIYVGGGSYQPEVFDLGILNPGEEMAVEVSVASPVAADSVNRVTIGAANGVKSSAYFLY